jgi:hypothetical protein
MPRSATYVSGIVIVISSLGVLGLVTYMGTSLRRRYAKYWEPRWRALCCCSSKNLCALILFVFFTGGAAGLLCVAQSN